MGGSLQAASLERRGVSEALQLCSSFAALQQQRACAGLGQVVRFAFGSMQEMFLVRGRGGRAGAGRGVFLR